MKIIAALLFWALIAAAAPNGIRAQTVAAVNEKIKKGEKTLVSVPVTVSDREGRYIPGLKKDDFTLYQDGVKQNIAFFATEDEPVSVALLLDTSASTKEVLGDIRDAAKDFIALLNPSDQCLVATYDSQVRIINPFTSDREILKKSLDKIRTDEKEGTVMLGAVAQIARDAFAGVKGRKVIVLLSDGKDYGSPLTKNDLLGQLEESDVLIYSIFYQTGAGFNKLAVAPDGSVREAKENVKPKKEKKPKVKKKGYTIMVPIPVAGDTFTPEEIKLTQKAADIEAVNSLQEMTDLTAGRFYLSDTPNLRSVFRRIAGELRQQYRLGFYAGEGDKTDVHSISVKVQRPDAVVRARGKFRAKQL
jgi:Ca-activated chloride channel homolog